MKKKIINSIKNQPELFNEDPKNNLWQRIEKSKLKAKRHRNFKRIIPLLAASLVLGIILLPNLNQDKSEIDFWSKNESYIKINNNDTSIKSMAFNNLIYFNKSMKIKERYKKIN